VEDSELCGDETAAGGTADRRALTNETGFWATDGVAVTEADAGAATDPAEYVKARTKTNFKRCFHVKLTPDFGATSSFQPLMRCPLLAPGKRIVLGRAHVPIADRGWSRSTSAWTPTLSSGNRPGR